MSDVTISYNTRHRITVLLSCLSTDTRIRLEQQERDNGHHGRRCKLRPVCSAQRDYDRRIKQTKAMLVEIADVQAALWEPEIQAAQLKDDAEAPDIPTDGV